MDLKIKLCGASHQLKWLRAFQKGLMRHGIKTPNIAPCHRNFIGGADLAIFWAHRQDAIINKQKKDGNNYLVLERGFIGDRTKFTSAGFNGLNGRASFLNHYPDPDRYLKHELFVYYGAPRLGSAGAYVLLLGQVSGDASIKHVDIDRWYSAAVDNIKAITDLPIYFRPHPLARPGTHPAGTKIKNGNLKSALADAALAVAYNSNSSVDAALAGVPTAVADLGSMAWPIADNMPLASWADITKPNEQKRKQWAHGLAYCQWTETEMANGETWDHLKQFYER